MERRTLRLDKGVEADRGVTRVLVVTEGGERERPGAVRTGRGGEGVDGVRRARVGGVEAVVADAVVVRRVGAQVVQRRVHVVLVDVGAPADPGRCEQVTHLRRYPVAQVEGTSADPQERLAHRQRHLPRHTHLGPGIGAVGQVPAERRHQRTVHGGRGGRRHQRGRRRGRDTPRAREGGTGGGDRATAQQTATGEGAAEVLVLLGHAQGVGEPVERPIAACPWTGHVPPIAWLVSYAPDVPSGRVKCRAPARTSSARAAGAAYASRNSPVEPSSPLTAPPVTTPA